MKHLLHLLGFILLTLTLSCERNSENQSNNIGYSAENSLVQKSENKSPAEKTDRQLIKEGIVEFETADLTFTRKKILEATQKYGGYISSDKSNKDANSYSTKIEIRVPKANFDQLLEEATEGIENFDIKEITIRDVTEEYIDIQARIKTKKEIEQRYLSLLEEAKGVSDILEIEKQIGQLRTEIESAEGRLNYLINKVQFSTLKINFYQTIPSQTTYGNKIKNGFESGWNNLMLFFVGLIHMWPFILIILGALMGIRIYKKKTNKLNKD